jgi:RNA recognition motif-containing protein
MKQNKKSSCFIEFDSPKTASTVLKTYNNQTINNVKLKLNWVNSHNNKEQNKYTVYIIII